MSLDLSALSLLSVKHVSNTTRPPVHAVYTPFLSCSLYTLHGPYNLVDVTRPHHHLSPNGRHVSMSPHGLLIPVPRPSHQVVNQRVATTIVRSFRDGTRNCSLTILNLPQSSVANSPLRLICITTRRLVVGPSLTRLTGGRPIIQHHLPWHQTRQTRRHMRVFPSAHRIQVEPRRPSYLVSLGRVPEDRHRRDRRRLYLPAHPISLQCTSTILPDHRSPTGRTSIRVNTNITIKR